MQILESKTGSQIIGKENTPSFASLFAWKFPARMLTGERNSLTKNHLFLRSFFKKKLISFFIFTFSVALGNTFYKNRTIQKRLGRNDSFRV